MRESVHPKDIKGLVFDCDGVMIDSVEANRLFYNVILEAFGRQPMTKEEEEFAFRSTSREALERMLPKEERQRIESVVTNVVDYKRDILPATRLMPGFLEFIHKAHAHDLRMAIDTNRTSDGIQRVLDFFTLPQYFDPVASSSSVSQPKPSPEGALSIARAWDMEPRKILFIGDSIDDEKAACAAGMPFLSFGPAGPATSLSAKNFASLAKWLFADDSVHN